MITSLSVVVPCYNESEVIREFYRRMKDSCEKEHVNYEIIFVDDGSKDVTWSIIKEFASLDGRVKGIRLFRNHGHQIALSAGIKSSTGNRVLLIDCDLQDPPELLHEMSQIMDKENCDVVYGKRIRRQGESYFKILTAIIFYRLINKISDIDIPMDTGDFRLMTKRIAKNLSIMPEKHKFVRGMIAWIGGKQMPVLYERDKRFAGSTKYSIKNMLLLATDAMVGFSRKPLMIATYLGIFSSFLAAGLMIWAVISALYYETTPGWASLMSVTALLSSMQLFSLGIMGEYLGRLYEAVQNRPDFLIAEEINLPISEQ